MKPDPCPICQVEMVVAREGVLKHPHNKCILEDIYFASDRWLKRVSQRAGCTCQSCGKKYHEDVRVPDEIWETIKPEGKPEGAGLLCGNCIVKRILTLLEAHKTHVGSFLTNLHAIMIDPLAEGTLPVKEVCGMLLKQAQQDREMLAEYHRIKFTGCAGTEYTHISNLEPRPPF